MKPIQRQKKTLCQKVEERRMLSHHFDRLWRVESTIDNLPPWIYRKKNVKGKNQLLANGRASPDYQTIKERLVRNKMIKIQRNGEQSDLLDKHFYEFSPHYPRTLLSNNSQSKLVTNRKIYQPPILRKKIEKTQGNQLQSKEHHIKLSKQATDIPWFHEENLSIDKDQSRKTSSASSRKSLKSTSQQSSRISDDQIKEIEADHDAEYNSRMKRLTQEIVDAAYYDERFIHDCVERYLNELPPGVEKTIFIQKVRAFLNELDIDLKSYADLFIESENQAQLEPVAISSTSQSDEITSSKCESKLSSISSKKSDHNKTSSVSEKTSSLSSSSISTASDNGKKFNLSMADIDDILEDRNIAAIRANIEKLEIESSCDQLEDAPKHQSPAEQQSEESADAFIESVGIQEEKWQREIDDHPSYYNNYDTEQNVYVPAEETPSIYSTSELYDLPPEDPINHEDYYHSSISDDHQLTSNSDGDQSNHSSSTIHRSRSTTSDDRSSIADGDEPPVVTRHPSQAEIRKKRQSFLSKLTEKKAKQETNEDDNQQSMFQQYSHEKNDSSPQSSAYSDDS